MNHKPVIGVPADRRMVDPHPFHMAGEKYVQAIVDGSDGLPFIIPALGDPLDVDDIIDNVDGILLTGSGSRLFFSLCVQIAGFIVDDLAEVQRICARGNVSARR